MFCQRLAYENDCDPVPRVIQTRFSVSRRASGRHRAGRLALVLLHGGDVNQIGLARLGRSGLSAKILPTPADAKDL